MKTIEKTAIIILLTLLFIGIALSYYKKTSQSHFQVITLEESEDIIPQKQKININTADRYTLMQLSGVGPALAQSIIDYRRANGLFSSTDELTKVKGIGTNKYQAIKDMIMVDE